MPDPSLSAVAIHGYDPTTYFDGAPRLGSPAHALEWSGEQWHFVDEAHRERFRAAPERFVPSYRGHCAFAMSIGKAVRASPSTWAIVDGRLFLQQNPVARLLFRLLPGRVARADANWRRHHRGP